MREQNIPDSEWTAIDDLLFAASSKKFFQRTLREIVITHHFLVFEGSGGVFSAGVGGGIVCGCGGASPIAKDLPMIAPYNRTVPLPTISSYDIAFP